MLLATLVFLFGSCLQFWLGAQHYFEATTRWCVRRFGTVPDPWLILRGQRGILVEKLMAAGSSKILSVMSAEGKTVVVTPKGHQKHLAMTYQIRAFFFTLDGNTDLRHFVGFVGVPRLNVALGCSVYVDTQAARQKHKVSITLD